MEPQAQECQQPPETGRGKEDSPLELPEKEWHCNTLALADKKYLELLASRTVRE